MADIAEEYRSSLSELNFNSKPHINMLTMLAEENAVHAPVIVDAIVDHINSVTPDVKLPSLYLVDSIVKNIGKAYISLFSKHLVHLFTSVFEKVDENIRSLLYKLRSTWTGIFPNTVLLQLDRSVVCMDPAWPILAKPQIHFNPKFLKDKAPVVQLPQKEDPMTVSQNALVEEVEMKKQELRLLQALHQKKKELITLQLKAALSSPAVSDSAKDDAKKIINSRDPRLSKKLAAASTVSDSTVLQSIVVVPKENKRNEKDSIGTASKKMKLESVSSPKKDSKYKPSSPEVESSSKLSVELKKSSKPAQVQKSRNKKHSINSENSSELINKLPLQQNRDFIKDSSPSNVNSISERSNELIKNNFVSKTFVTEENKYLFKPQPVMMTNEDTCHKNIKKLDPPPKPPLFLGNEDKDYRMLPKNVHERSVNESAYPKRPALPVVKSFLLDKKERKIYFVNDRSFAFMDDNIPRELTFQGPPKLIFIEGLLQPIELAFGQEVKFDIDGKCNYMRFGTPSREVYINDYPYEAQFGGPPFTAMLSDGKTHKVHIIGPLPRVITSESPAFELYEKFCLNNKEFLHRFDNEPSINNNNSSSDVHVGTRDVDMRVNSLKFSSTFFDFPVERMQDIDWQRIHVDNIQQTEWNVPKNSFETIKDIQPEFHSPRNSESNEWEQTFPLPEMQNSHMNCPPPLPPKQIINRFPGMSPLLPTPAYRNVDMNKRLVPMNQFPMNEHPIILPPSNMEQPGFIQNNIEQPTFLPPSSVPFSQPNLNNNEFRMNRPDLNMVQNYNIPKLSPPPLPPFMDSMQSTNSMATVSCTLTSSISYNNHPILSTPLHLPPPSVPLLNLPSQQPVTRVPVSLAVNTFSTTTQELSYSVHENVPTIPKSTTATSDMQLFMEKLKAAGLIKSDTSTPTTPASTSVAAVDSEKKEDEKEETPKEETIPEITFDSKCLKEYHPGVIAAIYFGSQCATCGMRFKEIQSEQYSRHLDWHFRKNRREKDGAKKPFSRRWYYEIKDWIQFKEFEDVDERAPSYFELQANSEPIEEEPENVVSVSCNECDSENCAVCGEQFELFWIEEEEEWHLRNAVKYDDQVYHPACYEDFKKANEPVTDVEMSFDDSVIDVQPDVEKLELDADTKTQATDGDVNIKTEMSDVDVNIKTEINDVDVSIKMEMSDVDVNIKAEGSDVGITTEVLDIDSKLKKEPMDVDDTVEKTDVIIDIKPKKVDPGVKDKAGELKLKDKSYSKRLNSKDEGKQLEDKSNLGRPVAKDIDTQLEDKSDSKRLNSKDDNMQLTEHIKIKEVTLTEDFGMEKQIKFKEDFRIEKEIKLKEDSEIENEIQLKEDSGIEKEIKLKEDSGIGKEIKLMEDSVLEIEIKLKEVSGIEKEIKLKKDTGIEEEIKLKEDSGIEKEIKSKDDFGIEKEVKIEEMELENAKSPVEIKEKDIQMEVVATENAKEPMVIKKEPIEDDKTKIDTSNDNPKTCTTSIETRPNVGSTDSNFGSTDSNVSPIDSNVSPTDSNVSPTNSNVSLTDTVNTVKNKQPSSHSENVPAKSEDELEDIEFRPPTPDPRFEILPPVSRGTEISNLCIIM